MKCCTGRCGAVKPLTSFHRDPTKRDGRASRCAECLSADRREARAERRAEQFEAAMGELGTDRRERRRVGRGRPYVDALAPPPDPDAAKRAAAIVAKADAVLGKLKP